MVFNPQSSNDGTPPRVPAFNAPPIVVWLGGIMFAIHLVRQLLPRELGQDVVFYFSVIPLHYLGDKSASVIELFVPLFSHIFLHADFMHVGFNALWLLAFGTPVARRLPLPRFLGLFFLTGVLGALVHIVMFQSSFGALMGASGAISGLMGAAVRFALFVPGGYMLAFRHGFNGGLVLQLSDPRILKFSGVWVVVNLVMGLAGGFILGGGQSIAWDVHIVGYLAGLLLFPYFDVLTSSGHGGGSDSKKGNHLRRVK